MTAYRRVYDSRHLRLTAKNRDRLRNHALGNRAWATFTIFFKFGNLLSVAVVDRVHPSGQTMCDEEYARVAHDLVDTAINRALALLADSDWCNVSLDEYIVPADVKRRTPVKTAEEQSEPAQPNVSWPTIEEFTPELGTERILEFIKVRFTGLLLS